jgi:hypothetical protein
MAQRIQTIFVDDLDGSEAVGTVRFGVDGADYEIDLSAAHARALAEALQKYIAAGRKVSNGPVRRPGRSRRATSGPDSAAVRAWAKSHGIKVSDRGRIPTEVIAKFNAAAGA